MSETRAVLFGFGAVAFLMLAVPVCLLWAMVAHEPPRPAKLDGTVSRFFLGDEKDHPAASSGSIPGVQRLVSSAAPEAAFAELAASGFACTTDSRAATCSRSLDWMSEHDDWRVSLQFDASGRVRAASADWRRTNL